MTQSSRALHFKITGPGLIKKLSDQVYRNEEVLKGLKKTHFKPNVDIEAKYA